jgi:uncharacterized protein
MSHRILAILARSPDHDPATIKTRLAPRLPRAGDRAVLYRALLSDTLSLARGLSGVELRVCVTPPGAAGAFAALGVGPDETRPQRDGGLGERQRGAFEDLFTEGAGIVVLIGSDLPALPPIHVARAFEALEADPEAVALGPAEDGGYYLVGLARGAEGKPAVPAIFDGIRWSSEHAFDDTVAAATRAGRRVALVPPWFDIDDGTSLDRARELLRDPVAAARAPATAALLSTRN